MAWIERDFPIEWLNPVALGEGNSKKPIYRLHKWWARRLGSVFRAILLATFSPDDTSPEDFWHRFCHGADLGGKVVLDPFMGGGTTLVEALRLGCRVIGVNINPVAWFVTKKEVEAVDLASLDAAFAELEHTVGEQIREYYRTVCPQGHPAEGMYYFWVKRATCARCGATVRLSPNYELSRYDTRVIAVCPRCLQIVEGSPQSAQCPECGLSLHPRQGVSGRGRFRCPECGEEQTILEAIRRKGAALDVELHALEGYCEICGRFFKRVDQTDIQVWKEAEAEFRRRADTLLIPHQAIPTKGRSDPRPVNHGYAHFRDMFNERQLLCLSLLLEHILRIPDQNIRELMLAAFSDSLNTNNMFCKYEVEWHKISLFFSLHAFHPIERPTENNVWGTRFGRGTFVKCFEKVRAAKAYAQRLYERLVDRRGRRYTQHTRGERAEGYLVNRFEELQTTDRAVLLRCQSSEDLSFIPDRSVDAVITDPPYFDNVQYSELADFFYVWLRLALKDIYPWFEPELSGRAEEIVQNERLGKSADFFTGGLSRVFTECRRVLKDEGLLVFTFHHNQLWAWQGLAQALLEAGFTVSATPVVRSEGRGEVHSSEGNIRYDCVFVCRKAPPPSGKRPLPSWPVLQQAILEDAIRWARRTRHSGMPINEVDVRTIVMGKAVEHSVRAITGAAGVDRKAFMDSALTAMASVVDDVLAAVEQKVSIPYPPVRQLALFVMESRNPETPSSDSR